MLLLQLLLAPSTILQSGVAAPKIALAPASALDERGVVASAAVAPMEVVASIPRAEGEAQAAKIISDALSKSGAGLIEVRRIDAAKEIAETLARSRNVTYLPNTSGGGGGMLLGLNAAGQ